MLEEDEGADGGLEVGGEGEDVGESGGGHGEEDILHVDDEEGGGHDGKDKLSGGASLSNEDMRRIGDVREAREKDRQDNRRLSAIYMAKVL